LGIIQNISFTHPFSCVEPVPGPAPALIQVLCAWTGSPELLACELLRQTTNRSVAVSEGAESVAERQYIMGAVGCTLTKLVPALTATGEYRSSQEESLLIGQILEGRKDLFGDLLQPHLTAVLRLVRAKMRNDSEADDVIQQTILKAFTRLEQFRFEASFKTWLIRIAIREVL
jgi:sigma-70-like protein